MNDWIKNFISLFKYTPVDTSRMQGSNPLVHLMGYEKAYGLPQPHDYAAHVAAYKSWAYACAWKNATSVAKCKLCLYKKSYDANGDEVLDKIVQHPFLDVINSVNPFSNKFELFTLTQLFQELTGNSYWWMPRNNLGVPYMIWSIPSHWVKIIPSETEFIAGYVVRVPHSGKDMPFDADEIVQFRFPSPFDMFYGAGPLWAARYGLDLNEQIKTWGINFFLNNAQPSGILTTEQGVSPEQYKRLRDRWNDKYKGSKNAGKMAILEAGLKYQQVGSSIKDSGFPEVSKEIRDEILAIFGVPASKLGLVEDVNRANADANDYTYQKETILPRLTLIEEKINERIMPIYDINLVVKFENPVPEDFQAKLQERRENIASGFSTIDEEREKEGLEPFGLPETSKPLISFGLVPAGSPKPELGLEEDPKKDDKEKAIVKDARTKLKDQKWEVFANATRPQERHFAEVMKRYFTAQHSEVMRNLNKYKEANGAVNKDLAAFILFNLKEANQKLGNVSRASVRNAFVTGLQLGTRETNKPIDFNLFEPNILRAVEDRLGFFTDKVNESTSQLLKNALDEGLQGGESISDIGKRIDKIFNYSEDFRSKRIAQTEVIGATNSGQIRAYDEAGVKEKEWLTARDEKVRDSHQIDGQVVNLHQSFTTKSDTKLQYPGDRSAGAPPEEVINCRCTVVPIVRV